MATTLDTVIQLLLQPTLTTSFGKLSPVINPNIALTSGTGIGQGDLAFVDERVASTTPDVLDLQGGGLIGIDGKAFNPAKIVAICVYNISTTAAEILSQVGGGSNGFNTWLNGTTGVKVGPGGFMCNVNPSAAGWSVVAGTGDLLPVTAASGTPTYRIGLVGRSV